MTRSRMKARQPIQSGRASLRFHGSNPIGSLIATKYYKTGKRNHVTCSHVSGCLQSFPLPGKFVDPPVGKRLCFDSFLLFSPPLGMTFHFQICCFTDSSLTPSSSFTHRSDLVVIEVKPPHEPHPPEGVRVQLGQVVLLQVQHSWSNE